MSEKNTSIGVTLRDARIAKGFTLDDLQQTTKIQKRYLIAIEDGNFADLPGDFYVRAFIKQYAETVGLNGSELLETYSDELPNTKTQEYVDRVNEENPSTRSAQRKVDERSAKFRRQAPIVLAVIVVVAVLIGIWYASTKSSQQSTHSQNVDSSSVSVSGSSAKKAGSSSKAVSKKAKKASSSKTNQSSFSKVSTSGSATTFDLKHAPKVKTIKLKSSASAWVSVSAGSSTVYSGTLSANQIKTVKVSSSATSVVLNLGNAPATKITIGGKRLPISTSTSSATTTSSTTSGTTATSSSSTTTSQVQNITVNFK